MKKGWKKKRLVLTENIKNSILKGKLEKKTKKKKIS
jgi:hypothetical protein